MSKTNAEYQRAYRLRKKAEKIALVGQFNRGEVDLPEMMRIDHAARVRELEAEVAHLKRQLAARPAPVPVGEMRPVQAIETEHRYSSRPFTPVPKR